MDNLPETRVHDDTQDLKLLLAVRNESQRDNFSGAT